MAIGIIRNIGGGYTPSVLKIAGNERINWNSSGGNKYALPTYLPENTAITLAGGSGSYVTIMYTSQDIDCSKYSKLIIQGSMSLNRGLGYQSTSVRFCILDPNERQLDELSLNEHGTRSTTITHTIDVSSLDKFKLRLWTQTGDVDAYGRYVFSTIRLEK